MIEVLSNSKTSGDQALVIDYHLLEGRRQEYLSNLNKAIENHEIALEKSIQIDDNKRKGDALHRLSFYYRWLTNKEQVNRVYEQVKPLLKSSQKDVLGIANLSLGDYYHYVSNNDSAIYHYNKALSIFKALDDKARIIDTL